MKKLATRPGRKGLFPMQLILGEETEWEVQSSKLANAFEFVDVTGPVALSCRPKFSFKPLSFR
ncbi:hypothetical protein N9Y00_10010, partial [Tateyamaria sp.]|nr:hypothetical protein [Tateyamaria sp.]